MSPECTSVLRAEQSVADSFEITEHSAGRETNEYVGPARTLNELLAAFELVHDAYVERGYMEPTPSRLRITVHNLRSDTATFVVTRPRPADGAPSGGAGVAELFGTASVVLCRRGPLPSAQCFPDHLGEGRNTERRAAEVIMLAHRAEQGKRSAAEFRRLLALFRCIMDYARLCDVDDLFISVHPHHVSFYERKLGFEVVEGPRPYGGVRNAPAVLLHLDIAAIHERAENVDPMTRDFFLARRPDPAVLAGYRSTPLQVLSAARRREAAARIAKSQRGARASAGIDPTVVAA